MQYTKEFKLKNENELWECVDNKQTYIPNFPPRITFQTHKRCNLACRFCYHFAHKFFDNRSPLDMPVMDLRLIEKVAEELFPTLQYYETTLLGDPFLSPNLDNELRLAARYGVFMRPTTNGTTLTEANLDKVDGRMDWLKCSFDSHIRGLYNNIRIGARYENTVKKLKRFNKRRETMNPKPWFRMGIVLNDLNFETLPDYFLWAHEEMGVDDVEMMGLNVDRDHIESLQIFDKAAQVNKVLDKVIDLALTKKYRLRLDFTQMPEPGGDKFVCQKRSAELREMQKPMGYVPPRDFEKMSYVIQNPRNAWETNDYGYVWSNNMRRQDVCVEFLNRPFVIDNGVVEACGNCNTFFMGNLKHQNFAEIWNSELYQDIRRKMYNGTINKDWYAACNDCICMGVTYDRGRSDHRHKSFYRVTTTEAKGENRVPVGPTHGPVDWPEEFSLENYQQRVDMFKDYEVVLPAKGKFYLSDLDGKAGAAESKTEIRLDKVNTFTPLALSGKRYIKGIYAEAPSSITYEIPEGSSVFRADAGLYDTENPGRRIMNDSPGFVGEAVMRVLLDGKEVFHSGKLTTQTSARSVDIDVSGGRQLTLITEAFDPNRPNFCWTVWADAHFYMK